MIMLSCHLRDMYIQLKKSKYGKDSHRSLTWKEVSMTEQKLLNLPLIKNEKKQTSHEGQGIGYMYLLRIAG
jgi:hypothetical protein